MKTHKKLVSILCAVALLVSALPAASAVSAEPLSKYAGKTIPVQVVEETENGLTSRVISVAIPEGATKAEENTLVCAAAVGRVPGRTRFSNGTPDYYINSVDGEVKLQHNNEERIGGGTPVGASYSKLDRITISFDVEDVSQVEAWLGFQLRSSTTPSSTTDWEEMQPLHNTWRVVFISSEFKELSNYNDGIDIYAKALRNEAIIISNIVILGIRN